MSSYLSDWIEAEEDSARVRAAHPECTGRKDCPASEGGHVLECNRFRRLLYPELYANFDKRDDR